MLQRLLRLRLLIFCVCLVGLAPMPIWAAPSDVPAACELAAALPPAIRAGLQASRIDLMAIDTAQAAVDQLTLTLSMCAPEAERGTAQAMLQLLAQALPSLSRHAGPPYQGPIARLIVLAPIEELRTYGADGLIDADGVIYLHPESPTWAVVHEGAHYWANRRNFAERWLREGYAEYLTGLALADLGRPERSPLPNTGCEQVVLRAWDDDPSFPDHCGYRVGAVVFHELAQQVGEDQLRSTLRALTDGPQQVTSWSLLIGLELASGRDLTPIMARHVFPPDEHELLERWRILHQQLERTSALAASLDVAIPMITTAVEDWDFETLERWLPQLLPVLEAASAIDQRCRELALACRALWQSLPTDPAALATLTEQLHQMDRLLDEYAPLYEHAQTLGLGVPADLAQVVATVAPAADARIRHAMAILERGRALDRTCQAMAAPCGDSWQQRWRAGDLAAAAAAIVALSDLLQGAAQVEQHCGSLVAACRQIWHPQLLSGSLEAAHRTLNDLDQALGHAANTDQRCDDLIEACRRLWRSALESGQSAAVERALNQIDTTLDQARALEREAGAAGLPRPRGWRAAFEAGDMARASAEIAASAGVLPYLTWLSTELATPVRGPATIVYALLGDPATLLAAAGQAFADGDLEVAVALADRAAYAHTAAARLHDWLPILALLMLLLIGSLILVRRPAPPRRDSNNLLAELLAQPPGRSTQSKH